MGSCKSLSMPNKTVISNFNVIEDNSTLTHDTCSISKIFKNFSNLVESLLINLLKHPAVQSLINNTVLGRFCNCSCLLSGWHYWEKSLKIRQDIKSSKAAGVDKRLERFLKDGADILAKQVCALQCVNLLRSP